MYEYKALIRNTITNETREDIFKSPTESLALDKARRSIDENEVVELIWIF